MPGRTRTDFIVVHCADTYADMDIGVKEIRQWHTMPPPKGRGWSDIGYAAVIRRDGRVEMGRDLDHHIPDFDEVGAHVTGYNTVSLGICLVGGKSRANGGPEANFTDAQYKSLRRVLKELKVRYPKAQVVGHRDLNPGKACPSFDVKRWWGEMEAKGL